MANGDGLMEQNLNIKWHRLFETREPLHRVPHQDDDISFLRGFKAITAALSFSLSSVITPFEDA